MNTKWDGDSEAGYNPAEIRNYDKVLKIVDLYDHDSVFMPAEKLVEHIEKLGWKCRKPKVKRTDEPIYWVARRRDARAWVAVMGDTLTAHATSIREFALKCTSIYEAKCLCGQMAGEWVAVPVYRKVKK